MYTNRAGDISYITWIKWWICHSPSLNCHCFSKTYVYWITSVLCIFSNKLDGVICTRMQSNKIIPVSAFIDVHTFIYRLSLAVCNLIGLHPGTNYTIKFVTEYAEDRSDPVYRVKIRCLTSLSTIFELYVSVSW
jgi:hypothetical protein